MSFNEHNSVEHYIIHQLSGTNLNSQTVGEEAPSEGNINYLNLHNQNIK